MRLMSGTWMFLATMTLVSAVSAAGGGARHVSDPAVLFLCSFSHLEVSTEIHLFGCA